MKSEICGICKDKKPMRKIQSKKGYELYKCIYCGNVKDLGMRIEDENHTNYLLKGEPEHFDIGNSDVTQNIKRDKND